MKPKHQRLVFITVSVVFLCLSVVITLRAFRDNLVFFYSPSDLVSHTISPTQLIRVGGLVEAGTIVRNNNDDSIVRKKNFPTKSLLKIPEMFHIW